LLTFLLDEHSGQFAAPFFVKPEDADLLQMSIRSMKIFAFSYLFGWIDMCFSSLFTALDRPIRSLITATFGTLIFPILFLFILSSIWNLDGVWMMPTVAGAASGIITIILTVTMKSKNNERSPLC
jgi:Na+-driven multidrug efflux pump